MKKSQTTQHLDEIDLRQGLGDIIYGMRGGSALDEKKQYKAWATRFKALWKRWWASRKNLASESRDTKASRLADRAITENKLDKLDRLLENIIVQELDLFGDGTQTRVYKQGMMNQFLQQTYPQIWQQIEQNPQATAQYNKIRDSYSDLFGASLDELAEFLYGFAGAGAAAAGSSDKPGSTAPKTPERRSGETRAAEEMPSSEEILNHIASLNTEQARQQALKTPAGNTAANKLYQQAQAWSKLVAELDRIQKS